MDGIRCSQCGKECKDRRGLWGHVRIAHGERLPAQTVQGVKGEMARMKAALEGTIARLQNRIRELEGLLTYPCSVCRKPIIMGPEERQTFLEAMEGWGHAQCLEKRQNTWG